MSGVLSVAGKRVSGESVRSQNGNYYFKLEMTIRN